MLAAHVTTVHSRNDVRIRLKECRSLAATGKRNVELLVADSSPDEEEGHLSIRGLGEIPGGRLKRFLAGNRKVFTAVRRSGARLVHFHDPELVAAALLLRISGRRVIYDVHEDMPRQILAKHWLPPWLRRPTALVVGLLEVLVGWWVDGIVAATPRIAARFPPSRTVMVRNYPILEEFGGSGYMEGTSTFAYVGVIADIRGASTMVSAMELIGDHPGVRLSLAGNFSPPGIRQRLEQRRGWQRVDWLGWLDRDGVRGLLERACAGLVVLQPEPNYLDALPVKLFEYMAAGLPVIASDFPLWREIVEDAGCGLLVNPEDPAAIADAMRWLLQHPDEARVMGQRGREAAAGKYNWAAEARTLEGFYQRLGV